MTRRPGVHPEASVHSVEASVLDHKGCTLQGFLCRFEAKVYRSAKLVFHLIQNLCRPQQNADMRIVSAGMHTFRILAGKRKSRCLMYPRKSVDIGSEHDTLSRLSAVNYAKESRMIRKCLVFDAHGIKIRRNRLGGFNLMHRWLRMSMIISSSSDYIIFTSLRHFPNIFHFVYLL